MKKSLIPITTAVVVASSALLAVPAYAGGGGGHGGHHGSSTITAGEPTVVTEGLLGPFSLEIDRDRVALLSQNFAGLLTRVHLPLKGDT